MTDQFWVRVNNLSGYPVTLDPRLVFEVDRFSDAMPGGSEAASVVVSGPALALRDLVYWLGFSLHISSEATPNAWSGMIDGLDLRLGVETHQYRLEDVSNRLQVLYSYEDVNGETVASSTDWAADTESVDRFGYRELRHSADGLDETAAERLRDQLLGRLALVEPSSIEIDMGAGSDAEAKIYGVGLWSTLGLRYYGNSAGREDHAVGSGDIALGVGFITDYFGTLSEPYNRLYDHLAQWDGFDVGVQFLVLNSQYNGRYIVKNEASAEAQRVVVSDNIKFESRDKIYSDDQLFSPFSAGEYLKVSGSASNSRFHFVTNSEPGSISVREGVTGDIAAEPAGATITITQGSTVTVEEEIAGQEFPGAYSGVTCTAYGVRVAQAFYNQSGAPFTVDRIGLNLWKVGTPTDDVVLELCANDNGLPGTVLDSATMDPEDISRVPDWRWFVFSNTVSLAAGTAYWIRVTRAGGFVANNYYRLAIDEDGTYDAGDMLVHDGGSTWLAHPDGADLCFRVWGAVETTEQIRAIAEATGQFLSTVTVRGAGSDIDSNQYRDGTLTGLDEIEALLDIGSDDGDGLSATVTHDGALVVDALPSSTSPALALSEAGLRWRLGGGPVVPGTLVSGQWVAINNAPVGQGFAKTPAVLIAWSEYDVKSGTLQIRRQGAPDPFAVGEVVQG